MKSSARMRAYVPVIRRFVGRVLLFHSAVGSRLGLNATDVSCLRLLEDEAMSAGELSDRIGLTGAATTALIDRLERAGFARRERSKGDRMAKRLAKYSAEEFVVILDFLEQTSAALGIEVQALKKSAKEGRSQAL